MPGAIAGSSTGNNLPSFGNKALQYPDVLVIDYDGFVSTETANFASSTGPSASPRPTFAVATTTLTAWLVRNLWHRGCFFSILFCHCP
jgi:hypothetical protein